MTLPEIFKMPKEVDAITRLYDYILWMIPKIDTFPRNRKFILCDRIPKYKPSPPGLVARANDRAGKPIKK